MELLKRAGCGDLDGVKRLIQQGVDVNTVNCCNETALYFACDNEHTEVAQYLLDNGASVNLGANSLIPAVRYNHYACVKLLLEYHADANCTNSKRESPVSVAIGKRQYSTILLLLQHGANPTTSLGDMAVQLLQHTKPKHAKAVQKLINFAFKLGLAELAEHFLSYVGYSKLELYPDAAYYSAKNNWPNILSKLIEKGVDVNEMSEDQTPLGVACANGHECITSLLLVNRADPNVRDGFGRTALHYAVDHYAFTPRSETSTAAILLSAAGANVNMPDRDGASVAVRPLLSSNFRSIFPFVPSHHAHRVEFFVPFPTVKSASQSVKNSLRY